MSERPLLVLLTFSSLLACGRVTLGTGRDSHGQGGKAGIDTTDLGGASGESEVGVSSGGRSGSSDSGAGGGAQNGGRGGTAGDFGMGAGGSAIGGDGQPPRVEPGGATGIDPFRCAPGLVPMLDGPAAVRLPSAPSVGVAADFDHDGTLDLATANLDGTVSVLAGNGDSSLAPSETYGTGLMDDPSPGPVAIAAADLDGDGEVDLVSLFSTSAEVTVRLGNGNGTFGRELGHAMDAAPRAFAVGDYDLDGSLDLAVAYDGSVTVLPGHGDGSFGPSVTVLTELNRGALGSGDFDEDGKLELAVAGDGGLIVLRGDGHGGFERMPTVAASPGGFSVLIADVNQDFHLDAALTVRCTRGADASAQVLLGAGDGTFAVQPSYEARCPAVTAIGDLDRDGFPELIGGPTNVLPGTREGGFEPVVPNPQPMGGNVLALGDWNGDQHLDLATAVGDLVVIRAGNGDFTFGPLGAVTFPFIEDVSSLALGDLDDNGTLDVVAGSSATALVNVVLGTGDGFWSTPMARPTGGGFAPLLRLGDLNGDRQLDLVTAGREDDSVSVLLGTGGGSFAVDQHYDTAATVSALVIADLNGDQVPDVVTVAQSPPTLGVLLGLGDGGFAPRLDQSLDFEAWSVAAGDVNGDKQQDLVMAGNGVSVLIGSGNGRFEASRYRVTQSTRMVALGDLNGDELLDMATANYEGDYGSLSVFLGNGDGTFGDPTDVTTSVDSVALADLNVDGKLDIVVSGGDSQVMLGAGDGTFPCVTRFGLGSFMYDVALGDVDRDGRLDVVVSTPRPYVFLSPH